MDSTHEDMMVGRDILNYRIVSCIGKGGMGTVYLAQHKNIQSQRAAIKMVNKEMVNGYTRDSLHQEAERLAELKHSNIVTFYDYHIDEEGNIYLIMEYADGISLSRYVGEITGPIVSERICSIFEPILDAVGYAHKKNIVHCDLKPANIMIGEDGTNPKVLDFGIAQMIKSDNGNPDELIVGTPSYMSPEQAQGGHIDARSDIYSLGVILHQLLTGRKPYETTVMTEADIYQAVVSEPLPKMSLYYPYVSEKLQEVVDKATAKNPEDRYQSCAEFKKALHQAVYKKSPLKRILLIAGAAMVLLAGVSLMIWNYNRLKVSYFHDYVELNFVPRGINEIPKDQLSHVAAAYRFEYRRNKLLRVAHINGKENLIGRIPNEDCNILIDQYFSYTESGKVSSVRVQDQNGRVIFIKSFNDNHSVATFQFGDGYSTEQSISISYGNPKVIPTVVPSSKVGISRWLLSYNTSSGALQGIRYANANNQPVCDENGIYGCNIICDDNGFVSQIYYIDSLGKEKSTLDGVAFKMLQYDNDRISQVLFYNTEGSPAGYPSAGILSHRYNYDDYGNVTSVSYLNSSGTPTSTAQGYAGIQYRYAADGSLSAIVYTDSVSSPVNTVGGYASIQFEYDGNGFMSKMQYLSASDKPVNNSAGLSYITLINDSKGNVLQQWYYKKDGNCASDSMGISGYMMEYDSLGLCQKMSFFDSTTNKMLNRDGVASYAFEYDAKGLLVKVTSCGLDGKPTADKRGVMVTKYEYDNLGRLSQRLCFDESGTKPISVDDAEGFNYLYYKRVMN